MTTAKFKKGQIVTDFQYDIIKSKVLAVSIKSDGYVMYCLETWVCNPNCEPYLQAKKEWVAERYLKAL